MTVTTASEQDEFTTIAKAEVIVTKECILEAEVNDWPAQPGFPASTDICAVISGTVLTLSPEQALAAAAKFAEFNTLLVSLAAQAIAHQGGAR
ncbi:hypothetical protein GXW83_27545 [Streptacidiphilus sp. PB12-B1b]|uniref:hypothetical protein n=1 Tax=Streptacidiphilus sp. PB12-B1b TaxID=2705012 RepID=UPI0015FAA1C4|nr:hypothetical protein [Streptacidiphilus sp. PB12-B1b]QMU78900.1 hypothetical protein GXW83_27545 [Streptacidiphilus sp. PB12-B1b]